MENFTLQFPSKFKVVKYESLVTYPEEQLSSVMQFLKEEFESDQLRLDITSRVVLPRSMDWKGQSLLSIDSANIGRRRNQAKEEEIIFLEQALAPCLLRHGYYLS